MIGGSCAINAYICRNHSYSSAAAKSIFGHAAKVLPVRRCAALPIFAFLIIITFG
jgi:hypothetical protein